MEYQEEYNIEQEPAKRPEMLSVLCVLSFINAVWSALSNFISFAFYDTFQSLFAQMAAGEGIYEDMAEQMGDSWEIMAQASEMAFSIGRGYYFLEMALYVASFVGVLMMWKLQKRGFHIYAIAQILMLIVITVFTKITFGPVLWTALFIAMYYPHYKKSMQ